MDIEWAKDAPSGKIFVVQARPETAVAQRAAAVGGASPLVLRDVTLDNARGAPVLARGRAVGEGAASGRVRLVSDAAHLADFEAGDVLVADATSPDWFD